MIDDGIYPGSILIVDKSIEASNNDVIIAAVDGEFTVKRLRKEHNGSLYLVPGNRQYSPIAVDENSAFYVWGVVTFSFRGFNWPKAQVCRVFD